MKSKKKIIIIALFLFLFAFLFLGVGFYFNGLSKPSHVMGIIIDEVEEQFTHFFYSKDELFVGDTFTYEGDLHFDLDSEYYKNQATINEEDVKKYHLIRNLDQLDTHFLLKQLAKNQSSYIELDAMLGEEELLKEKVYVENATEYYFINGIVKNYVNNGTCNYFETINEDNTSKDNLDYLYQYFFKALKDSFQEEYFERYDLTMEKINGKDQNVTQFVMNITEKRIHQILSDVLKSFKEDEKANSILTNVYPNFSSFKIKDDLDLFEKEESYVLSIYTTRFFFRPLKYELVHMIGDDKESFRFEGNLDGGMAYYVHNDQVVYQFPCEIDDHSIHIKIEDAFEKVMGEFKVEVEGYNQTINYSFDSDTKNYDFIYSSKFINFKKNKTYENTKKMSFKFVEDKVNHLSGDVVFNIKVENISKIDEDISMATLASRLSAEEKDAIDHKWESIKERMNQ